MTYPGSCTPGLEAKSGGWAHKCMNSKKSIRWRTASIVISVLLKKFCIKQKSKTSPTRVNKAAGVHYVKPFNRGWRVSTVSPNRHGLLIFYVEIWTNFCVVLQNMAEIPDIYIVIDDISPILDIHTGEKTKLYFLYILENWSNLAPHLIQTVIVLSQSCIFLQYTYNEGFMFVILVW